MEKYLGDIVVGDIGDIGQPQCYTCTKKQKKYCKRERRKTCDIVVGQCYIVTNHNVTQVLPENMLARLQEYQLTILLNMKNHFMYFFFLNQSFTC